MTLFGIRNGPGQRSSKLLVPEAGGSQQGWTWTEWKAREAIVVREGLTLMLEWGDRPACSALARVMNNSPRSSVPKLQDRDPGQAGPEQAQQVPYQRLTACVRPVQLPTGARMCAGVRSHVPACEDGGRVRLAGCGATSAIGPDGMGGRSRFAATSLMRLCGR